jgi:hypothetical protein
VTYLHGERHVVADNFFFLAGFKKILDSNAPDLVETAWATWRWVSLYLLFAQTAMRAGGSYASLGGRILAGC